METKDIIKITALVFSKKKTIAQVSKEYKAIHGKELPIKSDLETLQAQLSLEEFINGNNEPQHSRRISNNALGTN